MKTKPKLRWALCRGKKPYDTYRLVEILDGESPADTDYRNGIPAADFHARGGPKLKPGEWRELTSWEFRFGDA